MKRDVEKLRQWQQRGKGLKQGGPLKRTSPIVKSNPERKAKLMDEQFGPQAEWCRHHPCVFCRPELYGNDLLAIEWFSEKRISDPHHSPTVGAGGKDRDTVPACSYHHARLDSPGHSEKSVARECGVDVRKVAAIIHRELRGNHTDHTSRLPLSVSKMTRGERSGMHGGRTTDQKGSGGRGQNQRPNNERKSG